MTNSKRRTAAAPITRGRLARRVIAAQRGTELSPLLRGVATSGLAKSVWSAPAPSAAARRAVAGRHARLGTAKRPRCVGLARLYQGCTNGRRPLGLIGVPQRPDQRKSLHPRRPTNSPPALRNSVSGPADTTQLGQTGLADRCSAGLRAPIRRSCPRDVPVHAGHGRTHPPVAPRARTGAAKRWTSLARVVCRRCAPAARPALRQQLIGQREGNATGADGGTSRSAPRRCDTCPGQLLSRTTAGERPVCVSRTTEGDANAARKA
jgi:hypothetical protein